MRCKRASHLMVARLDGVLDPATKKELDEHLAGCCTCQLEWQKLDAVNRLLRTASVSPAPRRLTAQVMARLERREQARRAVVGGLALAFGATALAALMLVPPAMGLLQNLEAAPTLFVGGVETFTQFRILVDGACRMLVVLLDQFALPLAVLVSASLVAAVALNGLWIATVRRLQAARW